MAMPTILRARGPCLQRLDRKAKTSVFSGLQAQKESIAQVVEGNRYRNVHDASSRVIAAFLREEGLLRICRGSRRAWCPRMHYFFFLMVSDIFLDWMCMTWKTLVIVHPIQSGRSRSGAIWNRIFENGLGPGAGDACHGGAWILCCTFYCKQSNPYETSFLMHTIGRK